MKDEFNNNPSGEYTDGSGYADVNNTDNSTQSYYSSGNAVQVNDQPKQL